MGQQPVVRDPAFEERVRGELSETHRGRIAAAARRQDHVSVQLAEPPRRRLQQHRLLRVHRPLRHVHPGAVVPEPAEPVRRRLVAVAVPEAGADVVHRRRKIAAVEIELRRAGHEVERHAARVLRHRDAERWKVVRGAHRIDGAPQIARQEIENAARRIRENIANASA